MPEDRKYDDEKRGFFRHENNAEVLRKGSFTIDGKKYYGAIIKSENNKGETKYEFLMSLGLLHLNEDKLTEKSPDMGGKIRFEGKQFKLGCWAREDRFGNPYTSLGFNPVEDGNEAHDNIGNLARPAF